MVVCGSHDLDAFSWRFDLEADVVVDDLGFAAEASRSFEHDLRARRLRRSQTGAHETFCLPEVLIGSRTRATLRFLNVVRHVFQFRGRNGPLLALPARASRFDVGTEHDSVFTHEAHVMRVCPVWIVGK